MLKTDRETRQRPTTYKLTVTETCAINKCDYDTDSFQESKRLRSAAKAS